METMAAASAGSATCLPAKGLDISLAALRRQDPYINNIVDVASQVALYTFNNRTNEWEKTEVEGTLFVYTRLASPRHGFTIMNRLSMENLTEPITKELDFQLQDPFLLYRNARLVIHGIWFYDKQDCQRIAQRMKALTQQEQALAQSQGGLLRSPGGGVGTGGAGGGVGGGGVEGQGVDILQMLANARTEYDKGGQSSSEPKEIGGSSMLYANPNLVKPIPVKPNPQDSGEAGEPRSLSLATLFGSQAPHPSPSNPALPLSPGGPALGPKPATGPPTMTATGSSRKPGSRPAVARSLSYDEPAGGGKATQGPVVGVAPVNTVSLMKAPMAGEVAAMTGLTHYGETSSSSAATAAARGPVVLRPPGSPYSAYVMGGGMAASPSAPQQQQQSPGPQQQQLCPAVQKLIQAGPRAPGGPPPGASLQTVSESPENRLCENGLTLEQHQHLHHQHQHHLHQQHLHHQHLHQNQHHQHHHPQYQQSLQHDHIQRLFQVQAQAQAQVLVPVPVSTAPCCSNPLPPPLIPALQQPAQPVTVESVAYPHPQHNQQHVYFSPCKTLPDPQAPSSQPASGVPPHELLQKLQLVQQEQSQATHEAPRHGPALAPRFQGATPTQNPGSALGPGNEAGKHFPVISPQRIPATVAPTLLLSPSVFSQAKGAVAAAAVGPPPQDGCPLPVPVTGPAAPRGPPVPEQQARLLSRNQLQETLLHLLQTDNSFIDCIYKAYVGGLAKGPGSKY